MKITIDISNDFWFHFWSDFGSILGPIWGQISGNFANFSQIPRKFSEFLVQFPDLVVSGRLDTLREQAVTQPDSGNSGKFPPEPILDPKMDPKIDPKSIQNSRFRFQVSGFKFHVSRFTLHVSRSSFYFKVGTVAGNASGNWIYIYISLPCLVRFS